MLPVRPEPAEQEPVPTGLWRRVSLPLVYSALLHVLLLLVALLYHGGRAPDAPQVVPVSFVTLSDRTINPPHPDKSVAPQEKSAGSASSEPSAAVKPRPSDDLDEKLRALAKLRQPGMAARLDETAEGRAETSAARDDDPTGPHAAYAVRDYIRAQVERRWNLDMALIGNKSVSVLIHVEITSGGIVKKVEIVDKTRFAEDKAFHEIALSARNAILLSSPFALPPGRYEDLMSMELSLDPRDVLR